MFNFNKTMAFSMIVAIFILTPMLASARVHFLEASDENAKNISPDKPCIIDYPLRQPCPAGQLAQSFCPTDSSYFKTCGCDTTKYKYDSSNCKDNKTLGANVCNGKSDSCTCNAAIYKYDNTNCTGGKALGGKTCDGKYETCGCAVEYSKTCSTGNLIPTNASDSCDGKYKACKCPTTYGTCTGSGQAGGAAGSAQCTEEDGTVKYASCKAEVNCEAPYYKNAESKCVLWDGVAAVAKTCADLITITKNGNITGNVLVWGTLNCADNQITLPQGQNLVGRAYYKGKYTEATDVDTNKFSKINWNFSVQNSSLTDPMAGLHVEHNAKVSDVTLSMTSTAKIGGIQAAVYSNGKQNLVFNNIDIYLDSSSVADDNYLYLNGISGVANSLTAKLSLTGKNFIRFNGNVYAGKDEGWGIQWQTRGDFRAIYSATVTMANDSYLSITGNGNFNGFDQVDATLSGNSKVEMSQTTNNNFIYGFTNYVFSNPLSKLTMKDNAFVNINGPKGWVMRNGVFSMAGNSKINAKGVSLIGDLASSSNGSLTMSNNSIVNLYVDNDLQGDGSYQEIVREGLTLNDSAQVNVKLTGKSRSRNLCYFAKINLNGSSVLRTSSNVEQSKSALGASSTLGQVFYYGCTLTMSGSSTAFFESKHIIYGSVTFNLASTSKLYSKSTGDTSNSTFSCSRGDISMTSASGAKFIVQATQRSSYNGIYTVPAYSAKRICNYYDCTYNGTVCHTDYSILGASKATLTSTEQTNFTNAMSTLSSATSF